MKKAVIIISALLIFAKPFCYGQQESKTYIGLKGGYNTSTANIYHQIFTYTADIGFNSGYQVGVVMMNFLRPHYGIQMELNYTQKGYVQRFDTGEPDFVTDFDFVELPFLVNVYSGKNELHFFANAGCFFEYLITAKTSGNITDTDEEDFHPFDPNRDPRIGYGFRGGVGGFYEFNFGTLMLEGSFSYSLSNFLDPITLDTGIPNISNQHVHRI